MGETARRPGLGGASIVLDSDGSYVDATPPALELLGVSLDQLRSLPPGSLATERPNEAEQAALRREWEASGATGAVGSATIRRPDGRLLRVKFLIDSDGDGRYVAHLRPAPESVDEGPVFRTIGKVLAEWRAAERRLEALEPDTPEWAATQADIEEFKTQYRQISDRRAPRH